MTRDRDHTHTHARPPRPRLAFLFRVLHELYTQEVDAALAEAGYSDIRTGQAKVFPFVPTDGAPVKDLAALAGVRKQTMAQAVEQLVQSGYLERRPNPKDARSRLVALTPRGQAARPIAIAAGQAVEDRWAKVVGAEEVEALRSGLRDLLERLEDDAVSDDAVSDDDSSDDDSSDDDSSDDDSSDDDSSDDDS